MSRPLMQHKIAQLEELFAAAKADAKTLKALEGELRHRQVPRAVALLSEVQGVLNGVKSDSSPVTVPKSTIVTPATHLDQQPDLWSEQSSSVPRIAPKPTATQLATPRPTSGPSASEVRVPIPPSTTSNATGTSLALSVDDAYRVLKATSGSTWEFIEQTRRQMVQQAHPERVAMLIPERRAQVQAEARRVNAAYAVLLRLRAGGS